VKPTWTVHCGIHHNANPNPVNLFVQCVRGIRHNGDVDASQYCIPDNSGDTYVSVFSNWKNEVIVLSKRRGQTFYIYELLMSLCSLL